MAATDFVTEALLDALNANLAAAHNTLKNRIGTLASLSTTDKSNLVAAINEVLGIANAAAGGGVSINDGATNTTQTWSSTKVQAQIDALKTALLGGATSTYDTFQELKDLLDAVDSDSDSAIAALTTAVGNRLRFDAPQTLDSTQRAQALANLGIVASTADFAGDFNATIA